MPDQDNEQPGPDQAPAGTGSPPRPSLLLVTTISGTLRHFLLPYAAHLRALGWRVDAAAAGCTSDDGLRGAFDHRYDLPLSRSVFDIGGAMRGVRALSAVLETEPDIVHVHTPIAAFVARYAVRRMPAARRPAVIYTAHGFHFHPGGQAITNAAFLAAERTAGRWTDRLVVINDEDHEAARRHRIVGADRLVRMPGIGVDVDAFSRRSISSDALARARESVGAEPGTALFAVVGELNRNKRAGDAIRALAWMHHRDARLVLLGDGRERANLEALADRSGVRSRVTFAGFVPDVRPLVAAATALILPSKREGLARSIMEALCLEVPAVVSSARGNRELVAEGSGFVFPTGDVPALAAKLDWLVENPEAAAEMGRQGRTRMIERYGLPNLIRRHQEMYESVLAARRARAGRSGTRARRTG